MPWSSFYWLNSFIFIYVLFWFDRNIVNGGRETGRGNYGYEHDRVNGHSYPSETPMVTFKNSNPAETPGIAINDSSVTQVRPKII